MAFQVCSAGETQPPVIAATDQAALKARKGRQVEVTGTVSTVGTSKSKFFTFISFEGVHPGGFTAVVKSLDLADIERASGSNLEAALPGRKVAVRGKITFYNETPQIEITDPAQLRVLP